MTTKKSRLSLGYLFLAALAAIGIGLGFLRLNNGLGTTTSLSDSYPWGLWIVYDVFFVPFSAGAFMILAVAHIYNRKEYHAVARPVVLAGFLGEIMVIVILLMDLGRWHQFYNILFPWYWNINSFMFQVSLCLTVYMGIMVLEMAPVLLERLSWHRLLRFIKAMTVVIAIVGCVLSALHQSALGSLFLLLPYRLHPLWWSSLLPLLFFVSAAFGGLSMAILVALLSFRALKRPLKRGLLSELARIVSFMLGIYLILKVGDPFAAGEFRLLFTDGWWSVLFWVEVIIGVVTPMILFGIRKVRKTDRGLILGSACVLTGLLLNRATVSLIAQRAPSGTTYVPHWMEILISAAAVAGGILLFALAVRLLPILPEVGERTRSPMPAGWSHKKMALLFGGLCLLTLLVIVGLQPIAQAEATKAQAPSPSAGIESPRAGTCQACHEKSETLIKAGANADELTRLTVEPQALETPHGRIICTTCHYGNETTEDMQASHLGMITDPTQGDAHLCVACHSALPEEFPQDRLRTPHDRVTHGKLSDVSCSDCHGAVGHGFDPVTGDVICPMGVCLDCHQSRQLDSELGDCDACHLPAHAPVPAMECNACHQSTEAWAEVEAAMHPLALIGGHAEARCLDCHQRLSPTVDTQCADCHQPPGDSHYGATCEQCHTPASFQEAQLPDHPVALIGAHQRATCTGCHADGQQSPQYVCSDCHQQPEGHVPGPCNSCHTPEGWTSSAAFVKNLAPTIAHDVDGQEECLMCHDLAGKILPAPSNHGDYTDEQCVLCHKVRP